MPVRMTEASPQTPSGATKISVDVGKITAETSFGAELDLATAVPVEPHVESRDFIQVGQILRKILPLEVQIEEATTEPSSTGAEPAFIDVEMPVKKPMSIEPTVDATPRMVGFGGAVHEITIPPQETSNDPQNVEIVPLGPNNNGQTPSQDSAPSIAETPFVPELSLIEIPPNYSQTSVHSDSKLPDKNLADRQVLSPVQVHTPRSRPPIQFNAVLEKLPESTVQTTAEGLRDLGDFAASISEKPQAQRPFPSTMPAVQPIASRPQPAETKIVSQISTAISNTAKDTVEIRLDPPELGRVTISITQTESGLTATVISEKAEIADLLRRHAELLSRELSKSGFDEATLEFSHRDQQKDRPTSEDAPTRPSSASPEQSEVTTALETILRFQSGSLDIRL